MERIASSGSEVLLIITSVSNILALVAVILCNGLSPFIGVKLVGHCVCDHCGGMIHTLTYDRSE